MYTPTKTSPASTNSTMLVTVSAVVGRQRLQRFKMRDPLAQRVERRLGSAGQVQLGEDAADVGAHGALADHSAVGDLLVREPLGDQAQNLDLALGERLLDQR